MNNETAREYLRSLGANFDADQTTVLDFGNRTGEYRAAKTGCAIFDLSSRSQLELKGADRQKYLHNFCTNNIKELQPGDSCEAYVTNIKARVLAWIQVFAEEDRLMVGSDAGAIDILLPHLDRYLITEDVQLSDVSANYGEAFLSGPECETIFGELGWKFVEQGKCAEEEVEGKPVAVRRVDWFGVPGFLLNVERENAESVWEAIRTAGGTPAGMSAFEGLRIEAGLPKFGREVTDDYLAPELSRLGQTISYTKGCYLGQEPIARIDARGHVNRSLRGIRLETSSVPEIGTAIRDATSNQEIGKISSAAIVPGEPEETQVVALAFLKSTSLTAGTKIRVEIESAPIEGTVFGFPVE